MNSIDVLKFVNGLKNTSWHSIHKQNSQFFHRTIMLMIPSESIYSIKKANEWFKSIHEFCLDNVEEHLFNDCHDKEFRISTYGSGTWNGKHVSPTYDLSVPTISFNGTSIGSVITTKKVDNTIIETEDDVREMVSLRFYLSSNTALKSTLQSNSWYLNSIRRESLESLSDIKLKEFVNLNSDLFSSRIKKQYGIDN